MVIGSPTPTPTDTGRPKLKMSGIMKEIPMTEIGMDKLKRSGIMKADTYDRDWYRQAEEEWYQESNTYDRDWYGQARIIDHRRYSTPYFLNDERGDEQLPRRHSRWNPPYLIQLPDLKIG